MIVFASRAMLLAEGECKVNISPQPSSVDVLGIGTSTRNAALRRIFIGRQGLRAGWGALLFVVIVLVLYTIGERTQRHFIPVLPKGPIPFGLEFLDESLGLFIVLLATAVMARIEGRRFVTYGYAGSHWLVRLVSGIGWGFVALSTLVGVLWKSGLLTFDGLMLGGFAAWKYGLAWGMVSLVVGLLEESATRGYLQFTLTRGIGFWWAAVLLSLTFGAGHLTNNGESHWGVAAVAMGGFLFCISLWYTKSLWWAIGFHAGWDWAQSYFYGTPDSGLKIQNHLLISHPLGNPDWSGGTVGPEGSLLILPMLILMAFVMWLWWGVLRKPSE
jgi:membrane protease YdiL (CAAX protease family)